MKLYFAGAENLTHYQLLKECSVNKILQSYFWLKWHKPNYQEWDDILLDSWAFSAKTLWIWIDINEYIEYLKRYKDIVSVYANLDVIWDWEWTDKNQKFMELKWLTPLPTYHMWEPKQYFERLVHNYDYVWIWGLALCKNIKNIEIYLNYVFWYTFKNKLKTKFHGWWMTNPRFMKKYPFYSVDSTGWLAPQIYNRMVLFKWWELRWFNSSEARKNWWVDFSKLHYKERNKISIKAYLKFEEYCTKLHQVKGMEYWN